jgi:hypothetical protein
MIKVVVHRVLAEGGWKPFILRCYTHRIKNAGQNFDTLTELKAFYGIEKLVKTGEAWAISSRGKKYTWPEYEAEISEEFVM